MAGRGIVARLERMGAPWRWIDGDDRAIGAVLNCVEAEARSRGMVPLNESGPRRPVETAPLHAPGWDVPAQVVKRA